MDTSKLMPRLMGAVMFRQGVYDEVKADESFTPMAWILVIVTAVLSSIGFTRNPVSIIVLTVFAVISYFVGAWIISWVGRTVFKASVTTDELIRTLGLAYIWNIIHFLGFIPYLGGLFHLAAFILGGIAWVVAANAAIGPAWVQTTVIVIIGGLVVMVIVVIIGLKFLESLPPNWF